tara:strand:- start:4821 stop:5309 length:489 start_codon:yes stop_codon:yes gene_type:complete
MIEPLQQHRQLSQTSCAASGMEALLKLHNRIDSDSFPYQTTFGDKNIGFEQVHLLSEHGLIAHDERLPLEDAITKLETETNNGRFPLVSLLTVVQDVPIGWHIYVALSEGSELRLIDPAPTGGEIYAATTAEVRQKCKYTLEAVPDRQTIHILTYVETQTGK